MIKTSVFFTNKIKTILDFHYVIVRYTTTYYTALNGKVEIGTKK